MVMPQDLDRLISMVKVFSVTTLLIRVGEVSKIH